MADHFQGYQRLSFTQEFQDTLERFKQLIEWDVDIKATVKEADKRKGYFSAGVRYLMKKYVETRWPAFLAFQKEQLKKRGDEDAET
jgi:hypothetical protein